MRARELAKQGVDVLLCNAISASQAIILCALGIQIQRWVGDNLEAHIGRIADAERTVNRMPNYSYDGLKSNARHRRPARRYIGQPDEFLEKVA
jgi:predicted Fe-Mo cluster-binding NifX family protein